LNNFQKVYLCIPLFQIKPHLSYQWFGKFTFGRCWYLYKTRQISSSKRTLATHAVLVVALFFKGQLRFLKQILMEIVQLYWLLFRIGNQTPSIITRKVEQIAYFQKFTLELSEVRKQLWNGLMFKEIFIYIKWLNLQK
jgi:hypothetical protein